MNLIPWYYRWLAMVLLAAALVAFGWVKGAENVQQQWDTQASADKIVVAKVKAVKTAKTQEINHEVDRLTRRSDDYYRLRNASLPARLPGATGQPDAATKADAPDPAGRAEGSECNPADGAADAIVILEWQRWARAMKEAVIDPPGHN